MAQDPRANVVTETQDEEVLEATGGEDQVVLNSEEVRIDDTPVAASPAALGVEGRG